MFGNIFKFKMEVLSKKKTFLCLKCKIQINCWNNENNQKFGFFT